MRGNSGSLLASVACMLYDHPISLLHVKQPHDSFLTVLVIKCVPSRGEQPYSVGLQKLRPTPYCTLTRLSGIRGKPRYFRSAKTRGERHDRLAVEPIRHPDSMLQGRVCYGMLETCVPRTMLGIPHAPLPHLVHSIIRYVGHRPYIMEVFLGVKLVGVLWFSGL
jgi:hypothetical protein